jgi:acyl-CoA synthetase (AMP-forming)/AMP-acid ligase II
VATTITELFGAWATARPDDVVAVERHGLQRTLTIGDLAARSDRIASGLAAAGASTERPIVVWLPNRLEWIDAVAAAARLGSTVVGLNTRYRADELRHVLERSDAAVLVVVDEFAGTRFADVVTAAGTGALQTIVVVGAPGAGWADLGCAVTGWDDLDGPPLTDVEPRPDHLVAAFTTSGTTGHPKLAAHDQAGVVQHAADDAAAFDIRAGDRMLVDLPLCGVFGFSSLFAAVAARATTLLNERFDPADTARAIAAEGVTHYNAGDDMLLRILDTGVIRRGEHRWRAGVFANFANAARRVAERAEHELDVRLSGVYGMSEVFALLARWPSTMSTEQRARSGGIPVGTTEVRVVEPDTGAIVPAGEDGELCFRGPPVLTCYLGDPVATARAKGDDGWFRSGDLGRLSADGGFEYLARLGDSLRLRGFLVDPAEIEQRLERHPAVDIAQVVGVDRPGAGQVAVAFVRLTGSATPAELRAHTAAGIADFKVPSHIVVVDAFPTVDGPNGTKIRKRDLREVAATLVADA